MGRGKKLNASMRKLLVANKVSSIEVEDYLYMKTVVCDEFGNIITSPKKNDDSYRCYIFENKFSGNQIKIKI